MTRLLAGLCFSLLATAAAAQVVAPNVQIKRVSDEVIEIIKGDRDIKSGDQEKINKLVEAKVLPLFDFSRMTALAVGRGWPKANAAQKKTLVDEFRTLLVHTYSGALSNYKNEVIEFKPLHLAPADTDVTVRTQIKRPGSEPIGIDYSMEKTPGGWKVYDVVVAGVSLVTNYRDSFNSEIRENGVDGLIKSLASKNRSLDTQAGANPK